jgi:copper transport protein
MRTGARLGVAAALALGVWATVLSAPAFAHADLVGSDPEPGAELPAGEPPASVTLRFTESVRIPTDALRVLDGDGREVDDVGAARAGATGAEVVADLPRLDDGTYVVDWRVVSTDSHPVSGAFTFTVGEPTADPDALAGLVAGDDERGVAIAFGMARALAFASVLVLVGGVLFVRACWADAVNRPAVRALLWVGWVVALVTAVAGIGLQAAYSSGRDLSAAWDTDVLSDVLDTAFGRAWLARVPVLLLALGALRAPQRRRPPFVHAVDALLAVALLLTFTFAGHARSGRWVALATVTDLVHLAAVAAWLGGLVVLCTLLFDRARPRGARDATIRFSRYAGPAIGAAVLSGAVQTLRQTDGFDSLVDTTYGRLVLAKIGLVVFVVAAASVSRHVASEWRAARLRPAGPGAATVEADAEEWHDLRSAVVVEVAIAAVVLAVTAALVNTQPARVAAGADLPAAREAGPAPIAGFSDELTDPDDGLRFAVRVSPGLTGRNTVTIAVTTDTAEPEPFEPLEISARLVQAEQGIGPIAVALSADGEGSYSGAADLPVAGVWELEIRALRTDIDQAVVSTTFEVG